MSRSHLIPILILALLFVHPLGTAVATEDDTSGHPLPTPAPLPDAPAAFRGLATPGGHMTHFPSSDPYCWQLWVERAAAHQAICSGRDCPERRSQGCTVAWWVGSCRRSAISCQLAP